MTNTEPGFTASEIDESKALIEWVNTQPKIKDIFIHIPNEGRRTFGHGRLMKLIGLRRGVSDYFLPLPIGNLHGLWVELKRCKNAKVTIEQQAWLSQMRELGYAAEVGYGWEHAKGIIENYLKGNGGDNGSNLVGHSFFSNRCG